MIKNYIKIAWRNLVKGKLYSVINILGLAVGISCCLLIGLYVYQELRYDRFHAKGDQIYRVNHTLPGTDGLDRFAQTPKPLAPFLEANVPEVEEAVRLQKEDGVVRIENQLFKQEFLVAEEGFLDIFSFRLTKGNPNTIFSEREEVLLTESLARKLFGSLDVLGKSLELRVRGEYYQASVGGVLGDPPGYSSIQFKVVIPLEYWKKVDRSYERGNNWGSLRPATYVLLARISDPVKLAEKAGVQLQSKVPNQSSKTRIFEFQPITELHFDSSVEGGLEPTANISFVYISVAIAMLILLIACINFMSISIGHSASRAREVGMRKAMGARRGQVMKQFWGETFMVVLFALTLGLLLTELLLPYLNSIVGKSLEMNWLENPMLLALVLSTVLLTGLLAGSYPALYLSKFQPSQVFRNKIYIESNHLLIRSLSGVQFALAITLIIGTLFMNRQMDFMLNKSLGYEEDKVIQVRVPFEEGKNIVKDMQAALSSESIVREISGSWETLSSGGGEFQAREMVSGGNEIQGFTFGVGPKLSAVLNLEILQGRGLQEGRATSEVLVNEELVKAFDWENPIGKKLSRRFEFSDAEVVGVVKNFHFQSLHQDIAPLAIYAADYYTTAYMKLGGDEIAGALEQTQEAWSEVAPGLPFNFTFMDQQIEQQYRADSRWAHFVELASVVAIFLACMGLFGLASLATVKRSKEICIRKVLGATVAGVAALLSKDFLKPVVIALCFAIPLSYLLIQQWLQNFAYKIDIDPGTYIIATVAVIGLALLTVSWQSIRAAVANPAESLRSE